MTQAQINEGIRPLQNDQEIEGEALRAIYDYWNAQRGSNAFAPKSREYLLEFPEEARFWTIVDVAEDKDDFQCRFMGSDIQAAIGFDATDKFISKLIEETDGHEFMVNTRDLLLLTLKTSAPVLNGPKTVTIGERALYRFQTLVLPFGSAQNRAQQILAALEVLPEEE